MLIDDLDTKTIGLTDLRKRISIIPQEPVLFSTTLRLNLDPFEEFTDQEIWTALEEASTKTPIFLLFITLLSGRTKRCGS